MIARIASPADLTCCILHVTESNPHTQQYYHTLLDLSLCLKVAVSLYTSTINFSTLKKERKKIKMYRKIKIFAIKSNKLYIKYNFHYKIWISLCIYACKKRLLYIHYKLNHRSSFCIFYYTWQIKSNNLQ